MLYLIKFNKMKCFSHLVNYIKYWLVAVFFSLFFLWWFSNADLLKDVFKPEYDENSILTVWEGVNTVWATVIKWSAFWKPSLIVRATKILLSLVIALAVTMILYNGMMYIIQTWQWKESKDLTKNVAYIVVWILVALFSVVIITLIQSIPNTIDSGIEGENGSHSYDDEVIEK